jgi:hypothetical protein
MSFPILTNLDLTGNQLLNAGVQQLGSDPGSPFEGQIWENTSTHKIKAYLNGAVVVLLSGTVTSADIQDGTITDTDVATANKDGLVAVPSLRTIGTGAQQAMAGSTRLDTIASPTGNVGFNSQRITGLADGVAATDAATVGQISVATAGLDTKASVKAASTGNLTLSAPQTVDGVALVAGDRVLVKDQVSPSNNGLYLVAAGSWTRTTDFNSWANIPGSLMAVEQGTVNADAVYLSTADQGGTLGTTNVTFSRLNMPAVAGVVKFATTITGDAATTSFTVTHNLGTTDVQVQIFDVANDLMVLADVKRPTSNTVAIVFAVAPANAKAYRAVVVG